MNARQQTSQRRRRSQRSRVRPYLKAQLRAVALGVGLLVWPLVAQAQQTSRIAMVGLLSLQAAPPTGSDGTVLLREELRKLGWVDGQNIRFVGRYADGRRDQLAPMATDLVRERVDVIVTYGTQIVDVTRRATTTIPIVMSAADAGRFVSNLGRPEGNITGLSLVFEDLSAKRLELLREILAGQRRVALLLNVENPAHVKGIKEVQVAASRLGLELRAFEVRQADDLEPLFAEMAVWRTTAVYVFHDPVIDGMARRIAELSVHRRLPAISGLRVFADAGILMTYGPDIAAMHRRAAFFVDRILKGAKPADLPVEQPAKLELVINLKTAKLLGLTIPSSVMLRADQVIE
jgi:putative tryptophan/tyrosine transport system substrate-binding protein